MNYSLNIQMWFVILFEIPTSGKDFFPLRKWFTPDFRPLRK